jgi:hypothetical protein
MGQLCPVVKIGHFLLKNGWFQQVRNALLLAKVKIVIIIYQFKLKATQFFLSKPKFISR